MASSQVPGSPDQQHLAHRLRVLEARFEHIRTTRMRGLPVLHPGLRVQALGFELHAPDEHTPQTWASGVLVTPWFMNLLRLPLHRLDAVPALEMGWLAPGESAARKIGYPAYATQAQLIPASGATASGAQTLSFIGAFEGNGEPGEVGAFEACSLFSPMAEFADQASAVATGLEVLKLLRQVPEGQKPGVHQLEAPVAKSVNVPVADAGGLNRSRSDSASAHRAPDLSAVPARRSFLFGRSAGRQERT